MTRERSGSLVGATWLIGLGVVFLVQRAADMPWSQAWPLFVILGGTAGFVSEFVVFLSAWSSGHFVWAIAGILGAFVTAIYVLRATRAIFWGAGPTDDFHELTDARKTEWGALVILGTCLVLLGFWPRIILDHIAARARASKYREVRTRFTGCNDANTTGLRLR